MTASALFLTRAEVAELTGARTKRRQISVLVRNGVRHTINAAGWPMVARAVIEGSAQSDATQRHHWVSEPSFFRDCGPERELSR